MSIRQPSDPPTMLISVIIAVYSSSSVVVKWAWTWAGLVDLFLHFCAIWPGWPQL